MATNSTYKTNRGGQVNTTDDTQTVAATFATKSNKAYAIVAKITATETTDFDEQAFYVRHALFKNDGGTLSLVGSIGSVTTIESTGGWDVTLDASSTNIRVLVTGAAATNITWNVDLEVIEQGKWVENYGIQE